MINLFNAHIYNLSIHRVGNKSRNEAIFLSDKPYGLNDEIVPLLKEYFFKSFREKEENYFQFAHEVDIEYNDMFNLVTEIFSNPSDTHEVSKKITKHLFEQSNHPHIKNGEVYVAHITNLNIDNTIVDAVGVFKSEIQTDFILKVFNSMKKADWHQFQLLTKRPERMLKIAQELEEWPSNVWAGVSVESQAWTWRIDILKEIPAAIKFLSCEPLLGSLKLSLDNLNWVIVGGESGTGAREMKAEWVRDIREQCLEADVPFFFKQWGGVQKKKNGRELDGRTWNELPKIKETKQPQLSFK
jgi:hypothetical protein